MSERMTIPVLPLRDVVLFPGVTAPIGAGRPGTLRAIEAALATPDKLVFAVSQRENVEQVNPENLYTIGTIARIGQLQRGLAGMQLLLHGERRGIAMHVVEKDGFLQAVVRDAEELAPLNPEDPAFLALHREARSRAAELGQKSGLPEEVIQQVLAGVHDAGRFSDLVAGYVDITPVQRQTLLETLSVEDRLRRLLVHIQRQIGLVDAQEDIKSQVQEELGERQREMFLREQLKTIRRELGEDDESDDMEELRTKLAALELPADARTRGGPRTRPPRPDRARVHGGAGHPHLPRDHPRAAVERPERRTSRPARGAADPRRGSLRPRRREGPGAGVPGGAPVAGGAAGSGAAGQARPRSPDGPAAQQPRRPRLPRRREGPHPPLRRAPGRRQDLGGQVHRARHGAEVRPHLPRRRAGRGRHPRPPAHLRRRHDRPDPQRHAAGRHPEPRLPPRRGGQAERLVPGGPGGGPARGARPGAERLVRGSLPRRAVRPERGAVHRHGQLPAEHPGAAPRPDGDGGVQRVHRAGKAGHRAELPHPAPAGGERPLRARRSRSPTARCRRSSRATPGRRGCASWSASWASCRARWRAGSPRTRWSG